MISLNGHKSLYNVQKSFLGFSKIPNILVTNMDYKYIPIIPQPLLDSIIQNRCVPFVGSGFSKNSNIPDGMRMLDWTELGKAFAKEMQGFSFTNPLEAISAYEYTYYRPAMVEKMKELLLTGLVKPGGTHKAFCQLQFDIVCTTNFDHLLEDEYHLLVRPCNPIISEAQLSVAPSKNELTLLKIHGDIYHPDRIVATEEDYDKFLISNPLLATYLSNLLITRTPLFIGYSLDDPDFRQIWQIIKSRLGSLRRLAYTFMVGCSDAERERYESRGVKVINIKGEPSDYPTILTDIFKELKHYWDNNVKTVSGSETQSELEMPSDYQPRRLCYFSVAPQNLSFYKDYFFPLAIAHGFVPVTAESVISRDDNTMAKVSSIISKSEYFFLDLESKEAMYDWGQIISQGKTKSNIFILRSMEIGLSNSKSYNAHYKPDNFYENPEPIIKVAEKWFSEMSEKMSSKVATEPERLLNKNEYRAAVISAMVSLEVELRRLVKNQVGMMPLGLYQLSNAAMELQIVSKDDMAKIRKWNNLRNTIIHFGVEPEKESAEMVVKEILSFLSQIGNKAKSPN